MTISSHGVSPKTRSLLSRVTRLLIAAATVSLAGIQPLAFSGEGSSKASGDAFAWRASQGGNGHIYQVVVKGDKPITWKEAKREAVTRGGHLATITSQEEHEFVADLLRNKNFWNQVSSGPFRYYGPWLGGFQKEGAKEPDGGWKWVTGETFQWLTGDGSEPNNYWEQRDENRIQLFYIGEQPLTEEFIQTFNPKWNDVPKEGQGGVSAYVIEWDR